LILTPGVGGQPEPRITLAASTAEAGTGEGEGRKGPSMAERHNNPLNMKLGSDTKYLVDTGVATVGEPATDGGNFLRFKSMSDGLDAANKLLTGPKYNGLTVDAALRKWSNNGYGGEIAESVGIDPKLRVRDLSPNQLTWLTGKMVEREMGTTGVAKAAGVFGSTDVISPGGIAEVPKGTRMSIPNAIYTPQGAPATKPTGVAEAATPSARSDITVDISKESPSTTQIADLLDLPMATEAPPASSVTVDVEKQSPDAPVTPQQVVAEIRRNYDLRGLNPNQVSDIVGHALEARKISAAKRAANSQLIETEDGYISVNKETGELTPLTSGGKIDAKRLVELNPATSKLSEFSREMATPDNRLRGKMNESQGKALEYGSMMLQANEKQDRLERRVGSEQFANQRTYVLQTLESLPADVPMNVISQLLTGGSVVAGAVKSAYQTWLADNPKASEAERIRVLNSLGLGASEARAVAVMENRRLLTPEEREFLQNVTEFSVALLRRQSGAAINAGEFLTTFRQYFPTEGDKEGDVMRKMRTRRQAIRGLRSSAGRPLLVPDVD
jgi:hypothetical protein